MKKFKADVKAYAEWLIGLTFVVFIFATVFYYAWNGSLDPLISALGGTVQDIKFSTAWTTSYVTIGLVYLLAVPVKWTKGDVHA